MIAMLGLIALGGILPGGSPPPGNEPPDFQVVPFEMNDPNSYVAAFWRKGLGCPGSAGDLLYVCTPADLDDATNQGLVLAKSGPSLESGQAGATLTGLEGQLITVTNVALPMFGYDLRKELAFGAPSGSPVGSHCGNPDPTAALGTEGSPRFEIEAVDCVTLVKTTHTIVCGTPSLLDTALGAPAQGWSRLRWSPAEAVPPMTPGEKITGVKIFFDTGPDPADATLDNIGLAVLDNIFAFNNMVGTGQAHPTRPPDEDHGWGEDKDHDTCQHRHSDSHPERNRVDYSDRSKNTRMRSSNIRSASYAGSCVNLAGDGLVNGKPGYTYTYQACDLSTAPVAGIGTFSMSIVGPAGYRYQKAGTFTSGYVHNSR
jgi:hypothetical protein